MLTTGSGAFDDGTGCLTYNPGQMNGGVPASDERLGRNELGRAAKAAALGWLLGTVLAWLAGSSSDRS
jgi:hypothetical protein